jgi:hypothetical protein
VELGRAIATYSSYQGRAICAKTIFRSGCRRAIVSSSRKQANVYCEVSALFYRPWQFYNILIVAQEYTIRNHNKTFWGTDFPYSSVAESLAGLRSINGLVEGTALPRVAQITIDSIIHSEPFAQWWHAGHPG